MSQWGRRFKFGMHVSASKIKVMSALILGEQCQAALLDCEALDDADKFKVLQFDVHRKQIGHRRDQKQD